MSCILWACQISFLAVTDFFYELLRIVYIQVHLIWKQSFLSIRLLPSFVSNNYSLLYFIISLSFLGAVGALSCGVWVLVPWPGGSGSLLGEHRVLAAGTPGKSHPCHFFCCILLSYFLSACPGDYKLTYNDLVQINTELTTVVYRDFVPIWLHSFPLPLCFVI